ncbi:MAG TPA: tetratricopeptide repeat protein [Polyangiaceae bacterium]
MKDALDDLSARARRGLLDEAERVELEQRLVGSHEARLAHRAGREFDAEDLVLAGDEALVARINQRLLAERRPRRRPRVRAIGLVLGGVCVTMAAAAAGPGLAEGVEAFWSRSVGVQVPLLAPPPTRPSLPPGAARRGREAPTERVAPPSTPLAPPSPQASPEASARIGGGPALGAGARPEPSSEPIVDNPASMFAQASLARRQGDLRRAMALYAQLSRRFPGTAEADFAELALGTLSLQSGAAGQALGYFERYLAARPGGQLAVEALWGKTRALEALGREGEARRELQLLLDRYPQSTYATAARAKLGLPP